MLLLKLAAAPAVVWLSSQAGRRFGHRVAGLLGGFPLIAAPIVLFVALESSPASAAELAWVTMAVAPGIAVHCFVYAWLARLGLRWPGCLLLAWVSCVGVAWVLSGWVIRGLGGFALALGLGLAIAAAMPRTRGTPAPAAIPGSEILVRMASALALAALVMLGSAHFGTRISGVLLGFPITASVLPVFTLKLHGAEATVRLLSGFTTGLLGFAMHFYVFATALPILGPLGAFAGGFAACVATVSLVLHWQRRRAEGRG